VSDSQDKWPPPEYNLGPYDNLHALGVISSSYSEFESYLFDLYVHHLDANNVPREITEPLYFERSEYKRLELIKTIFSIYERVENAEVVKAINNLIKYFQWCKCTRDNLMHAKSDRPLFGEETDTLYLSKRVGKTATLNYMKFHLSTLRDVADRIRVGINSCADLNLYLKLRDTPPDKWTLWMRALSPQILPRIPNQPKKLEISEHPHTRLPAHLRKSQP